MDSQRTSMPTTGQSGMRWWTGQKKDPSPVHFKTKMCRNWILDEWCHWGSKCRFAHGDSELKLFPRPWTETEAEIMRLTKEICQMNVSQFPGEADPIEVGEAQEVMPQRTAPQVATCRKTSGNSEAGIPGAHVQGMSETTTTSASGSGTETETTETRTEARRSTESSSSSSSLSTRRSTKAEEKENAAIGSKARRKSKVELSGVAAEPPLKPFDPKTRKKTQENRARKRRRKEAEAKIKAEQERGLTEKKTRNQKRAEKRREERRKKSQEEGTHTKAQGSQRKKPRC